MILQTPFRRENGVLGSFAGEDWERFFSDFDVTPDFLLGKLKNTAVKHDEAFPEALAQASPWLTARDKKRRIAHFNFFVFLSVFL